MAGSNGKPARSQPPVNGSQTPPEPPLYPAPGWAARGDEVLWLPGALRPQQGAEAEDPAAMLETMPDDGLTEAEQVHFKRRKWLLRFTFHTRIADFARERDERVRDAERRLATSERVREEKRQRLGSELTQLVGDFAKRAETIAGCEATLAQALTEAGIEPCEPTVDGLKGAIRKSAMSMEELAGRPRAEEGRLGEPRGRWLRGSAALWEVVLGVPAGLVLAVCLGSLLGFLKLVDLQRPDRWPALAVAAAIGWAIVFLIGKSVERAVQMVGRPKERWMALLSIAVATLLVLAEVVAEATGMRELQLQRQMQQARLGQEMELLSWPIYGLIGLLVSGPYVLAKATGAWEKRQVSAFMHTLLFEQREQQEARLKTAAIRTAYECVMKLAYLRREQERSEQRRRELDEKLKTLECPATLDDAWLQEVAGKEASWSSESEAFHAEVRKLAGYGDPAEWAGTEPERVWSPGWWGRWVTTKWRRARRAPRQ